MPDWIANIPEAFWGLLRQMAPSLLLGLLIAGALSVLISTRFVRKHLGGSGLGSIIKASAFGVPLPLCSCGVIPVAASLHRGGASRGATVSFLISTPQTGVDSIAVTYSLLGPVFAVFRPLASLLSGFVGGLATSWADRGQSPPTQPAEEDADVEQPSVLRKLLRAVRFALVELPEDIGRSMLVGLAVAAVITVAVPASTFEQLLGGGLLSMLIMAVAGVPVYVCATASVPVAAALIAKGASPGAALVFLMTGPATNAATIVTIWRVLGHRSAIAYLATVVLMAIGLGLGLDVLFDAVNIPATSYAHKMLPGWIETVATVVLLVVLGVGAVRRSLSGKAMSLGSSEEAMKLNIEGMTCKHCAASVKQALLGCAGVVNAEVDLGRGLAMVEGPAAERNVLKQAVEALGYNVKNET